jgi:outer membrane protein assembly factor BamB
MRIERLAAWVLTFGTLVSASALALAQGWPQFRGPTGQGIAGDERVPIEWSETRNIAWKMPVPGRGWSSPSVADGHVWLTTAVVAGRAASLRLLGFDASDGHQVADVEVFKLYQDEFTTNPKNTDASPTPIVDGDRIYVHFGSRGTAAVSTSGAILWKTRLPYDSQHGNGGSPVLYRDLLIINCDGFDQAYVVALDRLTGKEKWRRSRRQPWSQAYSTPLVIRVGEQDQLVSVGAYFTTAFEPLTGKEIWRVGYREGFSNVPRPVYGSGLVFITTGFQQPSLLAVRPDGSGDVTKTHVAWTLSRGAPLTPSPILVGGDLYVVSDLGVLTVVDTRTGDVRWTARLGGNYSASPVLAGGRLYFASEEGVTTVVAPGAALERVAANTLDGAILASPAIADGALFIRTSGAIYKITAGSDPTRR